MAVREIGASITMDATKFKQEMSAVNSNLSGLQAEMKAVTAEFAENANSVDALTAKQKILDQQQAQQAEKVRALTKAYEEQAEATGEDSVEADKLRKQLNNARADYAKTTQAVEKNNEALEEAEKAERANSVAAKAAAAALEALKKGGTAAAGGVKLAGSALAATAKAAEKLVAAGGAAAGALTALVAAGVSTLSGYATDAASRAEAAMKEAEDYEKQAAEAAAKGDLKAAEQLREQAAAAAAKIDTRFSQLAENLVNLRGATTAAKDALATILLPALETLSGEGAALLKGFSEDLAACQGDTEKMGKVVAEYLKKAAKLIRKELPNLITLGKDVISAVVEGLGDAAPELLSAAGEIVDLLLTGLEENADAMGEAAIELIMSLTGFLLDHAPELLAAGIQMLTTMIAGITEHLDEVIPKVVEAIGLGFQALAEGGPELIEAGLKLILAIGKGIVENVPKLLEKGWEAIKQFARDLFSSDTVQALLDAAAEMVNNFLAGLKAAWVSVKEWALDALGNLFFGDSEVYEAAQRVGARAVELYEARARFGPGSSGHAGGLNYVPYDNYPAMLHKGEKVLTAAEASARSDRGGGRAVNITVNTTSLTRAQTEYLIRRVNDELGPDA